MIIKKIHGLEVLDSRGNPTVRAYVELENGIVGSASVPSGASTGTYEACELRDGDERYGGLGVQSAVEHIDIEINDCLMGKSIEDLKILDLLMIDLDGTDQKKELGANAILAVSMALARTYSLYKNEPLWKSLNKYYFQTEKPSFPRLMVNVINGGAHANWVMDFQEYMIIPRESEPSSSIRQASEIFHSLKALLKEQKQIISVGDEGGFAPELENNAHGFKLLNEAIKNAHYSRDEIDLGTDIAASEFYKEGQYILAKDNKKFTSAELSKYYQDLIKEHNLLSLEDPFAEDDWQSFSDFTNIVGSTQNTVGDDLYVTNIDRIKKGVEMHATNTILIKLNQIGSLFETVQAIMMARKAGWKIIISHRSGETEDPFIADLAVACGAEFIKTGSMSRSDRLAKYNRLLEIEAREFSK